jgi:3-hydroxyisobutyrate dehydrogenase-like beta-hydroxyacid dehydrogenase
VTTGEATVLGVFGLGEAGTAISAGLAAAGAVVRGYDPAPVATPPGVERCGSPKEAVVEAEAVLALTAEADMVEAASQALSDLPVGAVYADLGTAAPSLKRQLAEIVESRGLEFVDVALMAPVLGKGVATPALAAGKGAERFVALVRPFGMDVRAIGEDAGQAATRKLLRSVVVKGMAALFIEAVRAGQSAGCGEWLWDHLCAQVEEADAAFVRRIVESNAQHGVRRTDEMRASSKLLEELGVEPVMTASTARLLASVSERGLPHLPRA